MPVLADHGISLPAERQVEDVSILAASAGLTSDRADRLLLSECRALGPVFTELVRDTAQAAHVSARALSVQALLHLPRVATHSGWLKTAQVTRELSYGARRLQRDARARQLVSARTLALPELVFGPVAAATPDAVFSSLHYLRSARPGSYNFALLDPVDQLPVSLCSVSPLEWRRAGNQLDIKFGVPRERTWDVSRVYSCETAPPNAISFLLARVRSFMRHSAEKIELLTTAVDPNLGFAGSSYRAANWQQWLTVQPRPYLYHDYRYVTPRQLRASFGTSNLDELRAKNPGQRFDQSRVQLLDSLIFCCRISGETEPADPQSQRPLHR